MTQLHRRWFQFGLRELLMLPCIVALVIYVAIEGGRSTIQRIQIKTLRAQLQQTQAQVDRLRAREQAEFDELLELRAKLIATEAKHPPEGPRSVDDASAGES